MARPPVARRWWRGSELVAGGLAAALVSSVMVATLLAGSVPASAAVPLSIRVAGSQLVDGSGQPVRLLGVDRSGSEYACIQGWGFFDGPSDQASVAAIASWHANAVRIALNEDCWLGINGVSSAFGGANYQTAIENYVNLLNQNGIYAILELHWSAPGVTPATGQEPMPDADHSSDFWSSVASAFKNNPAVLFDLFNEPYPDNNQDTTAAWTCWQNGGTCPGVSFTTVGMQSLVNTVRAAGANNVIMLGGVEFAGSDDQWNAYKPTDPANQLAAAIHVYNFGPCTTVACWSSTLSDIGGVPLIAGEVGENDGGTSFFDSYLNWADQNGVSYLAWTWDTYGCGSAMSLVTDYNGTPCSPYGTDFQQHLASMAAPAFTSSASATFTPSTRGSFTITTTGYPASVLTETGILPSGVNWTDNGDGTATLAGVPTTIGTFPLTLSAVNGVEPAASQAFTLNVGNDVPTAITPGEWAQGVTSRNVTITGFGFTSGTAATVRASGQNVTFKSVSVVNATTMDAKLTIAAGATTGTRSITITQGRKSGTCTACLEIDPAPTMASLTPSTIAQGVTHQITVSGTGFVPGATVSFSGPSTKISVTILNLTSTSLSVKTVVGKAAAIGSYTLNLTNGNGGKVGLPSALTVSPAPTITNVSPSTLAPGHTDPFTITGTGFSPDATLTLPSGVTLSGMSVSPDGTTITGTIKVGSTRKAGSNLVVKVTDGPQGGFGTATGSVLTIT